MIQKVRLQRKFNLKGRIDYANSILQIIRLMISF